MVAMERLKDHLWERIILRKKPSFQYYWLKWMAMTPETKVQVKSKQGLNHLPKF